MSHFSKLDISNYPATGRWLERISARPAYQRMVKVDRDALAAS